MVYKTYSMLSLIMPWKRKKSEFTYISSSKSKFKVLQISFVVFSYSFGDLYKTDISIADGVSSIYVKAE